MNYKYMYNCWMVIKNKNTTNKLPDTEDLNKSKWT